MPAVNHVAEQVFGIMGTICWTGQIIPQIWKSWREKTTEGLSHWLMLIWGIASVFLGVFVILQDLNIPLIVQPQVFGFLSIVSWSQCLYYGFGNPLRKVVPILGITLALLGGFEAGMVFAVRPAVDRGTHWPVTFFGVMTSVILAAGLLPQYWEIFRFHEVKGISILFITIDTLGGVFSLLSLVFRKKFDVLAGVAYGLVVVLDGVVIILAVILNPQADRRRKRLTQEIAERESQLTTTIGILADDGRPVGPSREETLTDSHVPVGSQHPSASNRTSLTRIEKQADDDRTPRWDSISEKSFKETDSEELEKTS